MCIYESVCQFQCVPGSSYELRPEEVLSGYCGSAGNYLLLTLPDDAAARLLCQRAVLIR